MIGEAWRSLARELEDELRRDDPTATVRPGIDPSGLLRLEVSCARRTRAAARLAARRYEARATRMCEACGGPCTVGAGAAVTVLCAACRGH